MKGIATIFFSLFIFFCFESSFKKILMAIVKQNKSISLEKNVYNLSFSENSKKDQENLEILLIAQYDIKNLPRNHDKIKKKRVKKVLFKNLNKNFSINKSSTSNLNYKNQVTSVEKEFLTCPLYIKVRNSKKEISDFMQHSYNIASDLCNSSSRVGCKFSNFMRQTTCSNSKHFDLIDLENESNENKGVYDLPVDHSGSPLKIYVSFKVNNIEDLSMKHMDFRIDYYIESSWDVENIFFRKYMTRLCVNKNIDMEKKLSIILYQEDLRLFWLPDLYFPNSKSNEDDEKSHFRRPIFRNLLEIKFKKDKNGNPFLRFIYLTSGHSNILCPMKFEDYPSDVQQCVIKIRSFSFYEDYLKLIWRSLTINQFQLREYSVNISKDQDKEEDHFVLEMGPKNKNFTRLLVVFYFTRHLSSKIIDVYIPSMMLITLNYFTYYFGVNTYSSRCGIGIMVLLTLTIMFSKVRNELPGTSGVSGMEIWLLSCFICNIIQLVEASIVEKIYTDNCIDFFLKKQAKRKLELEYLGYNYSMFYDETSDEDETHFQNKSFNDSPKITNKLFEYLINQIKLFLLPDCNRKNPEYWCVFVDKIFRLMMPLLFFIFYFWYWNFLLKR